jgi:YbbR domain-containing protein
MAYHPFRHLGLKFVALALATLLWLSVAGEHVVERIVRAPVEFRDLPPQLEVVGDPPDAVDVRLKGPSAVLSRLDPGEVVAVLDLANARPGTRLFHIRGEDVRLPFGLEVVQVVPGTIGFEFEKAARRVVPVSAPVEGDPAPGFVVGTITTEPSTVEVTGPESRVKDLVEATTEPVSVANQTRPVRDVVAVGLIDASVRLVRPQDVTVMVQIHPAPVERELSGVLVRGRNLGEGLAAPAITPSTVNIGVRGVREALEGITPASLEAFVDLAGLGPGQYNLRVQTDPPQQFGVERITPAAVSVTIKSIK